MASFNKVILMGNLTRDPQTRFLPSGSALCEFSMAVNQKYKKQDGSAGEDVCFIDCSAFGKTGEIIQKFFAKGRPILVEGRLKFDSWQAQDGTKRSKHRVDVAAFQFVGDKAEQPGQPEPSQNNEPSPSSEPGDDHIPF